LIEYWAEQSSTTSRSWLRTAEKSRNLLRYNIDLYPSRAH